MAQHTTIYTLCDLEDDGVEEEAADNIAFSIGPEDYEVDACPEHAAAFREVLDHHAAMGRPRSGRRQHGPGRDRRRAGDRVKSSDIRAWAKNEGIEVSDKGRISDEIIARYHARNEHPELAEAV
jgi:hypothetical protein